MTEPVYIAQTTEPEHLDNPMAWFKAQGEKAHAKGGTWPRMSVDKLGAPPTILLFECWKERPKNAGEQRWQLKA